MRKSIPIRDDGTVLVPKDLVDQVFGRAREAVVHVRSGCLVLSPIYVDMESGQLPQILEEYHRFESLETVLQRHFQRADAQEVQFEGDLSVLSLNDVFLFLSASRKNGVLVVQQAERGRWGFFLQNGNLVFATGDDARACLAAYLLKRQFVTEQDLVSGLREHAEKQDRLKSLFEVSGLTLEEFREQWTRCIEEKIFSAFTLGKGRFSFLNGEVKSPFVLTLPLSTTNYVMEATRRIDEMARIQDRLPPEETLLTAAEDVTASTALSFEEEQVLGQVTGTRTLREVVLRAKVGEVEGKKAVASLIAAGLVRVAKPAAAAPPPPAPSAPSVPEEERRALLARLESYNDVFSTIYQALSMEVGGKVEVILGAFFKGLEPDGSLLYGLTLTPEGGLPDAAILQRLSALKEGREAALVKDLNELLYFELFAVKNSLGPEMESGIVEMAKTLLHG